MDKSLDDIITQKKASRVTARRTRRSSAGRAQVLGKPVISPRARVAAAAPPAKATTVQPQANADKIIVSNLPKDVNEVQIKELFHSTVGQLQSVNLHYDQNGLSKGVAEVHFQRKGDGNRAYQQYNNRLIDGNSPMKIEILVDPARAAPAPSLVSRVAPAAKAAAAAASTGPTTRSGTAARGRRRGGRGGGARKSDRPVKSAADLDAEMEDYTASNAPAAATA